MIEMSKDRYWEVYCDQTSDDGFTDICYSDKQGVTVTEPITDIKQQVANIRRMNGKSTEIIVSKLRS